MIKLKTLLQYKYILYLLLLIIILYALFNTNYNKTSKYNTSTTNIKGHIKKITNYNNRVSIYIKTDNKEMVLVNYYKDKDIINKVKLNDYVDVIGEVKIPTINTNFNTFNYKAYLYRKNIYITFNASEINVLKINKNIFYNIKTNISKYIEKFKSKNYLKIFILGDKSEIDSDIMDKYQNMGVIHLFSISGMHISIFLSILYFICRLLKLNSIVKILITLLILSFYSFITDFSVSLLRASLYAFLVLINKEYKFNFKRIDILITTLIILLITNIYYIHEIGFYFSYIFSFALILSTKLIKPIDNKIMKYISINIIIFLFSIPILIYSFYEINLLTPVLNMFYVFVVSTVIFPLSLLTLLIPLLDNVLYLLTNILETLTNKVDVINNFSLIFIKTNIVIIILYYVLLILFILRKKKIYLIIYILLIILNYNYIYINKKTYMIMLDVSQGDSSLISSNNFNILIDTGGNKTNLSKNVILPVLKSHGIKKLDFLILTHGDFDHIGESLNLINLFDIKNVIFNNDSFSENEEELVKILNKKGINYYKNINNITSEDFKIDVLSTKLYDNENDNSLVTYFKIYNYKILYTGDISSVVETNLIKKYSINNIDILKVSHHGSKSSSSIKFLEYINPKYSLISAGLNNMYKHPSKDTLERLNLVQSKIYNTIDDGSIKIIFRRNDLSIITCKNSIY